MESTVVERVTIVAKSKRFTKKELASKLGTSESLLGQKLNGSCRMDLATIIGILELFNDIDANWLLLGRGAMCTRLRCTLLRIIKCSIAICLSLCFASLA